MEEVRALVYFINQRNPGNLLRELAERRLSDLARMEDYVFPEYKKPCVVGRLNARKCIDINTGDVYSSVAECGAFIGKHRKTLINDISKGIFKHGVIPLYLL